MRRSSRPLVALAASVLALVTVPGTAAAESPTPTVWRTPGEGVRSGKAVPIQGRSESLQQRREPLVLIDEQRQGKKRELTLSADVLFAKDSAELNTSASGTLEEVAKRIKTSEATGPVDVVGHTDTDGSTAHNQDLSTRRAKAVADALEPRLTGTTLKPVGKGEKDPAVSPEKTEADKARNRRVTVTYTTTKTEPTEERSATDISVPPTQEAQPAKGAKAEGSRGAYQQTIVTDSGKSTVQLDVMSFDKQGPFVYVRVRLTVLSTPDGTFSSVDGVFSGDTGVTDDASNTVLHDEEGGTKLRYYVTGKGEPIRATIPDSLEEGQTTDVWFYYTAPERDRDHLDMYVPAFGVLKALEVKS